MGTGRQGFYELIRRQNNEVKPSRLRFSPTPGNAVDGCVTVYRTTLLQTPVKSQYRSENIFFFMGKNASFMSNLKPHGQRLLSRGN